MEDVFVSERTGISTSEKAGINSNRNNFSGNRTGTDPSIDSPITDCDENFLNYLKWHSLANEPDLLIFLSGKHYFYDREDLLGIKALINQQKLNQIKKLNEFLNTLHNVLAPDTNFIGCFLEYKARKGISLFSKIYKKITVFFNSNAVIEIDRNVVSVLLESNGFSIIDMTVIGGLTYFITQCL